MRLRVFFEEKICSTIWSMRIHHSSAFSSGISGELCEVLVE